MFLFEREKCNNHMNKVEIQNVYILIYYNRSKYNYLDFLGYVIYNEKQRNKISIQTVAIIFEFS